MISRTGSYALRILAFLAQQPPGIIQTSTIAASTGIPSNYLCKILNELRKGGLVEGRKGWGGGFSLRAGATERALEEVLTLFAGPAPGMTCVFGPGLFSPENPCHLHSQWESADRELRRFLSATTVADLTPRGRAS